MKVNTFLSTLITLQMFDSIYGQSFTTDKSSDLEYDRFGKIKDNNPRDLTEDDLWKSIESDEPPSQKSGQLEFDVERAEQTPDSRQMAPEMLGLGADSQDYRQMAPEDPGVTVYEDYDYNDDTNTGSDSSSQMDAEDGPNQGEGEDGSIADYDYSQNKTNDNNSTGPESDVSTGAESVSRESTTISGAEPSKESSKKEPIVTDGNTNPVPTIGPDVPNVPNTDGTNDHNSTSQPKSNNTPIYMMFVVSVIMALIGISWAIFQLCAIKGREADEEKRIAAAKASAETNPNSSPLPPPQPSEPQQEVQDKLQDETPEGEESPEAGIPKSEEVTNDQPPSDAPKPQQSTETVEQKTAETVTKKQSSEVPEGGASAQPNETTGASEQSSKQSSDEALKSQTTAESPPKPPSEDSLKDNAAQEPLKKPSEEEEPKV